MSNESHKVNKVIYILLAFFLGFVGIHKFYAGRPLKGLFYVLFCWTGIPWLIGIIEAVLAVFKSTDSDGNMIA